ncbi:hypothetical protein L915_13596 [Phytophthora nicotianae]|uniref:Uncharacterized protein n=1 Tax=Phytophthora nicotianae TaxID=4792 RepID=W2GCY9_PHYNI|nr:hypothetical protein L915_13596 [Phytophthora nicotianae]
MIRSYLNFVTPHKISETLVVPPGVEKETVNSTELCPVEGYLFGQVWWNIQVTHYYNTRHGRLCHFVIPQYNIHGNHLIGSERIKPYDTTPSSCYDDSYPFELYIYHGSFGYFSFYEEPTGTYCANDKTGYIVSRRFVTFETIETLGKRNKMTMLGGYRWHDGKLYYKPDALRSFGLLKMEEEDGTECLALRKLHWFTVPRNDLVVIDSGLSGEYQQMKQARVYCDDRGALPHVMSTGHTRYFTAQRKLLLVWLLAGIAPFVLQMRSYLKFVTPHKITQTLIVPSGIPEETTNLEELCPVRALFLSGVWWNVEPTHYYIVRGNRICHFVAPQYNTHGNYLIGPTKVDPYDTTPSNCADDSYAFDQYFYHGSFGYYSFYEEQTGTYCAKDNIVYIYGHGLGSFDINGSFLAKDRGNSGYRHSFYYGLVGSIWVTYRALVLRRSFISCKRYGRRCDEAGENLNRKEAVIFVQENLRLSAHGATIYHRFALVYLLVEGIMTDLFLLIANEGILAKIQYVSLGYNLSGFLLLIYEIVEASNCLREKYRLFFKRLWFSYETAFLGELLSAALQEQMITALNQANIFDKSKSTALAVSYYFWSLVGHGVFVLALTSFVLSVRTLWAIGYAWSRHQHHVRAIFTEPCCVDSVLKLRNKMTSLGGYRYDNGKLYYGASALKAFGLLQLEEKDGIEYLVLQKQYWLGTKRGNLFVIGTISGQGVEPCEERPCTSEVAFFNRRLGDHYMTAQRKLLLAWIVAGVLPFILLLRSYLKFATPHKITQNLVIPTDLEKESENLADFCPVEGMLLAGSWFNIQPTHYFTTEQGRLCHFVIPQYNVHGTFLIGNKSVDPYYMTPTSCANSSLKYSQYFYHGSIGYYSFYEEQTGSYCPKDKTAYIVGQGLGTYDINGQLLAEDRGRSQYRYSLWYSFGGAIWIAYRALVLRRSFISSKRQGQMCDEMNEDLNRKEALVLVQENLRLAAHGATNYHRAVVFYLLVESIMTDLFLLIANDGFLTKVQYVSMGYNLSGLLVLVFEIIENTRCLSEKLRVSIKRLLFSYETALVGEICTAALQQYSLTVLNRSNLRETRSTALAVSYYAWSLVGHGVFVLTTIALVISTRALWSLGYVWINHRTFAVITAPCCVDTILKLRNKMSLLGGYHWDNGKLYYTTSALKSFGILKVEEEDGMGFLVLRKIRWFRVLRDDLFVIATISNHQVEPCDQRRSTGVISFCDRRLGGPLVEIGTRDFNKGSILVKQKNNPPSTNENC